MGLSEAQAWLDKLPGDPDTAWITPGDVKAAVAQVYTDMAQPAVAIVADYASHPVNPRLGDLIYQTDADAALVWTGAGVGKGWKDVVELNPPAIRWNDLHSYLPGMLAWHEGNLWRADTFHLPSDGEEPGLGTGWSPTSGHIVEWEPRTFHTLDMVMHNGQLYYAAERMGVGDTPGSSVMWKLVGGGISVFATVGDLPTNIGREGDFGFVHATDELYIRVDTTIPGLFNAWKKISSGSSAVPVGTISMWPNLIPPTGFLLCAGIAFDAGANPNLFALLGSASTPDLTAQFVRGGIPDHVVLAHIIKAG